MFALGLVTQINYSVIIHHAYNIHRSVVILETITGNTHDIKIVSSQLIHDPVVQCWCREIIGNLPKAWSARTFRDKVSEKLRSEGIVIQACKIGLSTATYFLHELGMELVTPKKGIYKNGHERPDTVIARKEYTANLNVFKVSEV